MRGEDKGEGAGEEKGGEGEGWSRVKVRVGGYWAEERRKRLETEEEDEVRWRAQQTGGHRAEHTPVARSK